MEEFKKQGEEVKYAFSRSYVKGMLSFVAGLFLILYVLGYWQNLMTTVMVFVGVALMVMGAHRMGIFEMISHRMYGKGEKEKK